MLCSHAHWLCSLSWLRVSPIPGSCSPQHVAWFIARALGMSPVSCCLPLVVGCVLNSKHTSSYHEHIIHLGLRWRVHPHHGTRLRCDSWHCVAHDACASASTGCGACNGA